MARHDVGHDDIVRFAQDRVNLPKDKADEYRAQARRLREKLEGYLNEHPDFTLKKMMLSGSLAKGTALRSLKDIDVACYISGADAPGDVAKLLSCLAERLRTAFPHFSPDQVKPQTFSVTVQRSSRKTTTSRRLCETSPQQVATRSTVTGFKRTSRQNKNEPHFGTHHAPPCNPSLRCVFPRVRRYLFCLAAAQVNHQHTRSFRIGRHVYSPSQLTGTHVHSQASSINFLPLL